MRRAGRLFDRILDRENLRIAAHKALRGKRDRPDARLFASDLEANLLELRCALERGDVALGTWNQFTIRDPKVRLITAPCFRERVLHHAVMNVCEPVFERCLIDDTFACRKGKGRLAALDRARGFAGRFPFFLKLDARQYFASISHSILAARLRGLFKDPRLLDLFVRVIACYSTTPGRGLPIGSLTSQHFANFYLAAFDRFVKEGLRVAGYVRYMDDCVLWGDSTGRLKADLAEATVFLRDELCLDLKPGYINRTSHGMDFLGCRVFSTHTTLNRRSRVRFRRGFRALEDLLSKGRLDETTMQRRVEAMVAFTRARGVKSWRFRRAVIESVTEGGQGPRSG